MNKPRNDHEPPGPRQGVRTLAAVAHFDIVGYSRMISRDDAGTLTRIRSLRTALIEPRVRRHGGNIIQTAGDSLLVVFESILEAVRCACAIQRRVAAHDGNEDCEQPIRFRVGIEMGDVIADGTDLHGEGVIVAVRLETACPPGAICISRAVHDHVHGRIPAKATPAGRMALKNIARPVEAFILEVDPNDAASDDPAGTPPDHTAAASSPFGDLPAIAVLPLRSYGADAVEAHFADGLTDDLIAALSRWRSFPVIARNSTFATRGQDADVRSLGHQLGARYIVGGSVRRRSNGQVRVRIELIDAKTADHLLTEQFDEVSDDPEAVQDEIVRAIAGILAPEIARQERERAALRPRHDATAYDLVQRGEWHRQQNTREELEKAREAFEAALAIEPNSAKALTGLSIYHNTAGLRVWTSDRAATFRESLTWGSAAVAADPRDPHARVALGVAYINVGRRPEAIAELREAIRLNPSHAYARANLGQTFNYLNRPADALPELELALRLNPHDPLLYMWLPYVAASHYLAGRYRDCLAASERALGANPAYPHAVRYMAAALGQLGRIREASTLLPSLRRIDGTLADLESLTRLLFVTEAADHLLDGFRKAGFT